VTTVPNGGEHEFVRMTRGPAHHARRLKERPECSGAFHGGTFSDTRPLLGAGCDLITAGVGRLACAYAGRWDSVISEWL